ncbi:hypothetical protein [Actinokineospora sp. HUAS TT18]|uniref:hypothetical protein n=1 Tax=Actinokineospora sp. HUAS TT18 TaxID=3447451 RepID=UPI003F51EBBC
MTLLAVERIKLFSTRSSWWSIAGALGLTIGFTALTVATKPADFPLTMTQTQFGRMFGLMVIMVMAALAITTEYRFSTIRTTFQAVPKRSAPLLAKTAVVAGLATLVGLVTSFGSWGIARLLAPGADLAIDSAADWRLIAGTGLIYGLAAVIAVSVGILIRQSAGAISVLLIWPLLVESLVQLIPRIGEKIAWRMPFTNASEFLAGPTPGAAFSPWVGLAYFAAVAAALLTTALVVASKRDA